MKQNKENLTLQWMHERVLLDCSDCTPHAIVVIIVTVVIVGVLSVKVVRLHTAGLGHCSGHDINAFKRIVLFSTDSELLLENFVAGVLPKGGRDSTAVLASFRRVSALYLKLSN